MKIQNNKNLTAAQLLFTLSKIRRSIKQTSSDFARKEFFVGKSRKRRDKDNLNKLEKFSKLNRDFKTVKRNRDTR